MNEQMSTVFRKMYMNRWIRIPVKIIISMVVSKIVFDYSEHLTKFRRRNPNPRFVKIPHILVQTRRSISSQSIRTHALLLVLNLRRISSSSFYDLGSEKLL